MTAVAPTRVLVTPEDLLRMPDNNTLELVDGRIVEKNVSLESSAVEGQILFLIQTFLAGNPIARVFPSSLGYQCFPDAPDKVRKPDVTVVRNERLVTLPNPDPGFMPIVPDLAVEVISINDRVRDVNEKLREYFDAGFPLVWVVDPAPKTLTVYPLGQRPFILTAADEVSGDPVLPGFRCKVADFIPAPLPAQALAPAVRGGR